MERKKRRDNLLKFYITGMAANIYIILMLKGIPEAVFFLFIVYEVWIGYKMCITDENAKYHLDMVSTLCCVFFNAFFILFDLTVDIISGNKSSAKIVFIYLLIVYIFLMIGYETNRLHVYRRSSYRNYQSWTNNTRTSYHPDFFRGCESTVEIRRRYKDLCKRYHPDNQKTGNENVFKEIRAQYDEIHLI